MVQYKYFMHIHTHKQSHNVHNVLYSIGITQIAPSGNWQSIIQSNYLHLFTIKMWEDFLKTKKIIYTLAYKCMKRYPSCVCKKCVQKILICKNWNEKLIIINSVGNISINTYIYIQSKYNKLYHKRQLLKRETIHLITGNA